MLVGCVLGRTNYDVGLPDLHAKATVCVDRSGRIETSLRDGGTVGGNIRVFFWCGFDLFLATDFLNQASPCHLQNYHESSKFDTYHKQQHSLITYLQHTYLLRNKRDHDQLQDGEITGLQLQLQQRGNGNGHGHHWRHLLLCQPYATTCVHRQHQTPHQRLLRRPSCLVFRRRRRRSNTNNPPRGYGPHKPRLDGIHRRTPSYHQDEFIKFHRK